MRGRAGTYALPVSAEDLVHVVSQIAEGLDLPVVLDRLVGAARDTTGARYAAIGVLGPDGLHEEFRHVGLSPQQVASMGELPRGHGVLGLITRERQAVVAEDIGSHPASVGFPPGHPPMGSFLGVPLRVRGEVFGNLYLTDKPGGFDADDQASIEAMAAAASVAVDNARLYRSARNREEWSEASGQVTAALLGGLDEEDALEVVARHAREVARADAAALALPGTDGTLVVEVVDGEVGEHDMVGLGMTALRGLGDTVSCPLTDGEGEAGVLVLVRADGHRRFGPDDVAGAEGFAAHASLSLRLAAERRRGESRVLLDERARIARDLHDLAVQQLFAVGIELGRVREELPAGELAARVDAALGGLDTAVDHIRTTLRPLRPGTRADRPARAGRARRWRRRGRPRLRPVLEDRTDADEAAGWDPVLLHDLLAALAEALANVARHARAGSARVLLEVDRPTGSPGRPWSPAAGRRGRRGGRARPAGPRQRPGQPRRPGAAARRQLHGLAPRPGRDPGGVEPGWADPARCGPGRPSGPAGLRGHPGGDLGAPLEAELGHDRGDVVLHRLLADAEALPALAVAQPVPDALQHQPLGRGEHGERVLRAGSAAAPGPARRAAPGPRATARTASAIWVPRTVLSTKARAPTASDSAA